MEGAAQRICRDTQAACRPGAAGRAPRDRQAAQPKGGRGAKTDGQARAACGVSRWRLCPRPSRPAKPTDKPIRHAAGWPKGAWAPVRRLGALRGTPDDRGQDSKTGTAHARRRLPACQRALGVKGSKATPNGPAGLRSGRRQRLAGNQTFCPADFIAFNETAHGRFCLVYLLKL